MFSTLTGVVASAFGKANTVVAGTAPTVTTASLTSATVNVAYSFTLTATGTATITWTLQSGTLPAGLTLNSSGLISGTPTVTATTTGLVFRATNSAGFADSVALSLTVGAAGAATVFNKATSLALGLVNKNYLDPAGVDGIRLEPSAGVTWSSAGPFPAGLGFYNDGYLYGTPTATGQFPITLTTTSGAASTSRNVLLTVQSQTPASIVNTSLITGAINAPYVDVLTAYGDAPITWSVSGTLPSGITFDATNGFLTGVPTASFSGSLTFTATTVAGLADSKTFTLTISGTNTGTGFTTRPYAWQADKARLVDIRDNATVGTFETWLGNNSYTVPAPFFSVVASDSASRTIPTGSSGISQYTAPASNQLECWQIAFAGWLLNQPGANQNTSLSSTYRNQAVTELLDFLSRNGDGYYSAAYAPPGYSGTYILDAQGSLQTDPQIVAYFVGGIYDLCYDLLTVGQRTQCVNFLKNFAYTVESYSNNSWPVFVDPNHNLETHNNYWSSQSKALALICIVTKGDLGTSDYNTILNSYLVRQSWYQNQYRLPKWQGVQSTESFWYSPVNIHQFEGTRLFDNAYGSNFSANRQWTFDSYIKYWMLSVNPAISRFMRQGDTPTVYESKFQPIGATNWKALMVAAHHAETSSVGQVARKFVVDTFAARTTTDPMGAPWKGGQKVAWAISSSSAFDQFFYRDTAFTTSPISNFTDKYYAQPIPGGGSTFIRSTGTYSIGGTGRSVVVQNHKWDASNAYLSSSQPAYGHGVADGGSFLWYQADDEIVISPADFSSTGMLGLVSYGLPYPDWFNLITLDSESGYLSVGEPPWAADPADTYSVAKLLNGARNNPRYINRVDGSAASVPYFFQSLDLTKYFLNATLYTRQFVWLDDLQVLVLHDQVNTALADTKTWRLHVYGLPTIAGSTVTTTTRGGSNLVVRDLTSNGSFSSLNLYQYYDPNTEGQTPTRYNSQALINSFLGVGAPIGSRLFETKYPVYRITQPYTGNSLYSCKVLSINGRCAAASQSAIAGGIRVTMTINSAARTVDIFNDGSTPTVA